MMFTKLLSGKEMDDAGNRRWKYLTLFNNMVVIAGDHNLVSLSPYMIREKCIL